MARYVEERGEDRDDDRMLLLMRALRELVAGGDMVTSSDGSDMDGKGARRIKASDVQARVKEVADDDADTEWATSRQIGRMLASLRLRRAPRTGRERGWLLSRREADLLARSYGLDGDTSDAPSPADAHVTNVTERHNVTTADDSAVIYEVSL